jgi:glutamate synthase (NADPH/NADH) small chain
MSALGCECPPVLTDTQARLEASRCLMCDDPPCVAACPANVPVKNFIRAIRFETPRRAINLIREQNVLAGVCGLGCPVERLCVGACRSTDLSTPIAIGRLQHYAAMTELASGRKAPPAARNGKRVAIIGGGPSGLAAAAELARASVHAVVFEKNQRPGGIITYGVPAHRIPQDLVAGEVEYIKSLGVEIITSKTFGKDFTLDSLLKEGYAAVYIAAGAQHAAIPPVPGADLPGVHTWKDILDRWSAFNLGEGDRPSVPKSVVIVGGGSVAMDVAGAARRLGADEIDILCLESPVEMPADHVELEETRAAGARFHTRSMPVEVTGDKGRVTGLRAQRIRWKEPDRFVPDNAEPINGTEYWLPAEMVIFAIGARPAADLAEHLPDIDRDPAGRIKVNAETLATSRPGVFAGGDLASGGGTTIVQSVAEGKRAGQAITAYLKGSKS